MNKRRINDDQLLAHFVTFERFSDKEFAIAVLGQRCSKYGLTIHAEKTRLVDFRRPLLSGGRSREPGKPSTFDLPGFPHYWGRSRCGQRVVKRKKMSSRLIRCVQAIDRWCRAHRHDGSLTNMLFLAPDHKFSIEKRNVAIAKTPHSVRKLMPRCLCRKKLAPNIPPVLG